jgi:protein-L-isoaspartate O-methyltransferase
VVSKETECHVTPNREAIKMARALAWRSGLKVLEPSAGTGNLILALEDVGVDLQYVTAIERHGELYQACRHRLPQIGMMYQGCFLEYAAATSERYDRVIMNPPFRPCRQHIEAALSLLNPGGRLVALVPVTYQRTGIKEIERLPSDTFITARVLTKTVVIEL